MKNRLLDWLKIIEDLKAGNEPTCPCCGEHNVDYGYVALSSKEGYGAVWCNDCRHAIWLSRVFLNATEKKEIRDNLPRNLILEKW